MLFKLGTDLADQMQRSIAIRSSLATPGHKKAGVAEGKIGGAFAYAVLVTLRANLPRWLQRVSHS
jgi:hypothetical protein